MTAVKKLKRLNACSEAIEYVAQFKSLDEAWQKCERGDWMLWYVGKLSGRPESKSRKLSMLNNSYSVKSLRYFCHLKKYCLANGSQFSVIFYLNFLKAPKFPI